MSTAFSETEFKPTSNILLWGVITIYVWMYFIEVKEKRVASKFSIQDQRKLDTYLKPQSKKSCVAFFYINCTNLLQ